MHVEVDEKSGFCFGVIRAIEKAEQLLNSGVALYSLGEIVHNSVEVNRLKSKGLKVINREQLAALRKVTVLIRAHGEPPQTYEFAAKNDITLIDATCPVVLHLQSSISESYKKAKELGAQLVIFGQRGHAEVNGLVGQAKGDAIVLESVGELRLLDFSRSVILYSQTTKSLEQFALLCSEAQKHLRQGLLFEAHDTVCRQVSHRKPHLHLFARRHDVIIFVSGYNSSNGKELYQACSEVNERSYMVQDKDGLQAAWFAGCSSVGVCGATSTPRWLMNKVAEAIKTEQLHR
ncbi:MAG: 4-hydroxy-3-methylbut-2-enyl diphosphate reductase [Prevotellaceae bacterium]|jgi:4-hydroxy-3-methylbut-2-enyl diphosphate reductase|nr:4-hydroxy-3-methylbut-2-enyl diphosphate reductase [Prevotellaceae bacterium]